MKNFIQRNALKIFLILYFLFHFAAGWYIAEKYQVFYLHNDGEEYLELARSFAENGTLTSAKLKFCEAPRSGPVPDVFRAPLLPVITGIFIFLFRDAGIAMAFVQAMAAAALAWAFFAVGKRLSNSAGGGVLTLLLSLVQPVFFIFKVRFSSELFFTLFLVLFFHAYLLKERKYRFALMGLWSALAALIRPTAMLFPAAMVVFVLVKMLLPRLFGEYDFRKIFRDYILYFGCFMLTVLPVGLRNTVCSGSFTLTGYFGGFNFYVGNNLDNMRAYRLARNGKEFLFYQNRGWNKGMKIAADMPENTPPKEQQKIFMKKSFEELSQMTFPEKAALFFGKFRHFFRPWPLAGAHSAFVFGGIAMTGVFLYALGIAGFFLLKKRPDVILFLLMIIGTGCAAHTLVHLQMRHKVPFVDTCLIIAGGYFLRRIVNAFSCKKNASSCSREALQDSGK